jgi:hypothetical protein
VRELASVGRETGKLASSLHNNMRDIWGEVAESL